MTTASTNSEVWRDVLAVLEKNRFPNNCLADIIGDEEGNAQDKEAGDKKLDDDQEAPKKVMSVKYTR